MGGMLRNIPIQNIKCANRMKLYDFLEEVPTVVANDGVGKVREGSLSSMLHVSILIPKTCISHLRPRHDRDQGNTGNHSTLDFVSHKVSSDHAPTKNTDPHLMIIQLAIVHDADKFSLQ